MSPLEYKIVNKTYLKPTYLPTYPPISGDGSDSTNSSDSSDSSNCSDVSDSGNNSDSSYSSDSSDQKQ